MATLKKQEKTNKIASNNIFYSKVTSFVQCQLTGKDPEDGKDLRQEEKGMTEDGLLDGITGYWMSLSKLGDSEGQGSLTCCSPWGHKELDMTEQLNNHQAGPYGVFLEQISVSYVLCFASFIEKV